MKKFIHSAISKILFVSIIILLVVLRIIHEPHIMYVESHLLGIMHVYKADAAYEKGNIKDALKYYNKALIEYPEHSKARCNLANIYASLEDYSLAVEEYKKTLEYSPKYMLCRLNLGKVYAEDLSEYDEAIQEYNNVVKTNNKGIHIPLVYNSAKPNKKNKGISYYNMGLAYRWKAAFMPREKLLNNLYLRNAVEAYKKSLKFEKHDYDTYYNLAVTQHLLGDTKNAGLNYCKAISIKPLNYEAHVNLGILLDENKYHKEAIAEFNKAGLLLSDKSEEKEYTSYLNDLINESHRKQLIRDEEKYRKYIFYEEEDIKGKKKKGIFNFFSNLFNKDDAELDEDKENKKEEEKFGQVKKGKFVLKEESDSQIKKRMKECEAKKIFKGMK